MGKLSVEAAAAHLDLLGKYFDRTYPYSKLDIAAVPNFGAGAMENPGFVTFREELLLLDPEHVSIAARRTWLRWSHTSSRTSGSAISSPCSGGTTSGSTKRSRAG